MDESELAGEGLDALGETAILQGREGGANEGRLRLWTISLIGPVESVRAGGGRHTDKPNDPPSASSPPPRIVDLGGSTIQPTRSAMAGSASVGAVT